MCIYLGTELILEGVEGGGGLGNLSRGEGRSGGNDQSEKEKSANHGDYFDEDLESFESECRLIDDGLIIHSRALAGNTDALLQLKRSGG